MGEQDQRANTAVQSVDRALLVLEILAAAGQAGATEIAAELGVHKSTVSRLIAALEARGFVEPASERGKYRLGYAIARLARASSGHLDLVKLSQDVCDTLALDVGETVNLAILDGARIVNVVEAIGPEQITLRSWVGQSCPAYATSSGKLLLAGLDPADLRSRLGTTLEAFTANTVVNLDDLERELATARECGWASVAEELEIGLNAVSAPVYDAGSKVIAALSVSGPAYRFSPDRFAEIAKQTASAAEVISRRLGWIERERG
ncbi:MAG TPA: IclR family transcriptional regulator [Mycobacterium sp.]|jgi:DNA-binding IclR family transcriptional regulator|nr:IclR family transcriptional regulator [Mycobacterium sp.]